MLSNLLLLCVLAMNVAAFALMGYDKRQARHGGWRVPEKRLFLTAFLGGGVGAALGMRVFRHKTRHASFRILIPLAFVLNVLAYGFVWLRF